MPINLYESEITLPNGNKISGAFFGVMPNYQIATITGLGNASPSSVVFDVPTEFEALLNFEEVTDANNNVFVKIPKFYRKVLNVTDNQITSVAISNGKVDNDYYPYPCFVKEDGVTEIDYILIGKYMMSSTSVANSVNADSVTMSISNGRTLARALGSGYQLFDWQMWKLFQDLTMLKLKSVDTNNGSGFTSMLGIEHQRVFFWIDGIGRYNINYVFSYKPSKYIDSPNNRSEDYFLTYTAPTSDAVSITKLGYDSNHPFFNQVTEATGGSFTNYYCDGYYYIATQSSTPIQSSFGAGGSSCGVFKLNTNTPWSYASGVRLCYRPI